MRKIRRVKTTFKLNRKLRTSLREKVLPAALLSTSFLSLAVIGLYVLSYLFEIPDAIAITEKLNGIWEH